MKTMIQAAHEYGEGCDNESGSFLSHQLLAIRVKAFKEGCNWQYEQDKARIEKLEAENAIATATINKMQTLIKPWMNPNSTFGKDLNAAFNCGAEFNSKNPQLFTEYLDLRKLRSQGHE